MLSNQGCKGSVLKALMMVLASMVQSSNTQHDSLLFVTAPLLTFNSRTIQLQTSAHLWCLQPAIVLIFSRSMLSLSTVRSLMTDPSVACPDDRSTPLGKISWLRVSFVGAKSHKKRRDRQTEHAASHKRIKHKTQKRKYNLKKNI